MKIWALLLIHQFIFQGMFLTKNIVLARKLGFSVRGKNPEAVLSIIVFALFIVAAFLIGFLDPAFGQIKLFKSDSAVITGVVLMALSVIVSAAALIGLKDSWRVGVLEEQKTTLITTGVYRFSRNPYFLSYILMFLSYTLLLQSLILALLSIISLLAMDKMIRKEEEYLYTVHGESYMQYKRSTPRYLGL